MTKQQKNELYAYSKILEELADNEDGKYDDLNTFLIIKELASIFKDLTHELLDDAMLQVENEKGL